MTSNEFLSLFFATAALVVSLIGVVFNGLQIRRATQTLRLDEQVERVQAVMEFTRRYAEIVKGDDPAKLIGDEQRENELWILHSTEFYFFHHGVIPAFMYALWMIDLAELYTGPNGATARESHKKYVARYSPNYDAMIRFFSGIYERSNPGLDESVRNSDLDKFVTNWIA